MAIPTVKGRKKVTWMRTEKDASGLPVQRITHPVWWVMTDPDGYERFFDTRAEALAYIDEYSKQDT